MEQVTDFSFVLSQKDIENVEGFTAHISELQKQGKHKDVKLLIGRVEEIFRNGTITI